MTVRLKGSLAVLARPVRSPRDAILWEAGTVVRVDEVHDLERMVYTVHNARGTTARVLESGLRDVSPEDDVSTFENVEHATDALKNRQTVVLDDPVQQRKTIAEHAAGILRGRSIMNVNSIDAAQVVVLATYIENGATPEMAERIGAALEAAASPVRFAAGDVGDDVEVKWGTPAPRSVTEARAAMRAAGVPEADPRSYEAAVEHRQEMEDGRKLAEIQRAARVTLPDPLTLPAGDVAVGDATAHWLVLDKVSEREKVTLRVAYAAPKRNADRFDTLTLVKGAPVEVLSRLASLDDA